MIVTKLIDLFPQSVDPGLPLGCGEVSSRVAKAQPWILSPSTFLSTSWWETQKTWSSDVQLVQSCKVQLMPWITVLGFIAMILHRLE